uniref:Vesicle transport protein n=1 Tax=Phaeomonas parva TaxID=124430 RepID=A0A7S1TWS6_9STRA|mmetsp:Transcript_20680/g.62925  ORF Transcript_20680/g.62925 Transcript_20680/m.62925 type:complete len:143 (+) Transcript_20680:291-719(+)
MAYGTSSTMTSSGSSEPWLGGSSSMDEEFGCKQVCPDLTYQQRIIGFISCGCIGYLLAFAGAMALLARDEEGLNNFAVFYTMGNVVALCSGLFLMGPGKQCTKMWDETRRITSAVYLSLILIVFCLGKLYAPHESWTLSFLF